MTIYVTGDIHGSKTGVEQRIAQIENPTTDDIIIVCGDAGLEYGGQIQGSAKKAMKKFPGTWIILRGNHDTRYWRDHLVRHEIDGFNGNPLVSWTEDCFSGWHVSDKFGKGTLVQNKYSNIHYLPDAGGLYNIGGYNILMIPGAFSVDGDYRFAKRMPYEIEEQLHPYERDNLYKIAVDNKDDIDFVCAHTAPISVEFYIKYLFLDFIDQYSVDKTMEAWIDNVMRKVEDGKRFKHYFFGHFHDDKKLNEQYTMLFNSVVDLEDYVD